MQIDKILEAKLMTDLQEQISDDLQPLLEIAEGKKDIEKWNDYVIKLLENAQSKLHQLETEVRNKIASDVQDAISGWEEEDIAIILQAIWGENDKTNN